MLDPASVRKRTMTQAKPGMVASMKQTQIEHPTTRPTIQRRMIGKQRKLCLSEYVCYLLELNEDRNEIPKPLNDMALQAAIIKEYSHYESLVRAILDGTHSVAKFRHDYNSGLMLPTTWPAENPGHPPRLSLRYLDDGRPAKPRSRIVRKIVATNDELRVQLARFPKIQESLTDLMLRLGRQSKGGIYLPSAIE